MTPPYYVAVHGGFVVIEQYADSVFTFTTTDLREASVWNSFEEADRAGKNAVGKLYPPDLRHFAILSVPRS